MEVLLYSSGLNELRADEAMRTETRASSRRRHHRRKGTSTDLLGNCTRYARAAQFPTYRMRADMRCYTTYGPPSTIVASNSYEFFWPLLEFCTPQEYHIGGKHSHE